MAAFVSDGDITLPLQAYNVCKERDLVTEMVFLLGRMGNNKKALTLIIERLNDVNRVRIDCIYIVYL
jgi:hypothetical protein